jgi:hypothetical protein
VLVLDAELELELAFGQTCVEVESERDPVPEALCLALGLDDWAQAVPTVPTPSAPTAMLAATAALRSFVVMSLTSFLVRSTPPDQARPRNR